MRLDAFNFFYPFEGQLFMSGDNPHPGDALINAVRDVFDEDGAMPVAEAMDRIDENIRALGIPVVRHKWESPVRSEGWWELSNHDFPLKEATEYSFMDEFLRRLNRARFASGMSRIINVNLYDLWGDTKSMKRTEGSEGKTFWDTRIPMSGDPDYKDRARYDVRPLIAREIGLSPSGSKTGDVYLGMNLFIPRSWIRPDGGLDWAAIRASFKSVSSVIASPHTFLRKREWGRSNLKEIASSAFGLLAMTIRNATSGLLAMTIRNVTSGLLAMTTRYPLSAIRNTVKEFEKLLDRWSRSLKVSFRPFFYIAVAIFALDQMIKMIPHILDIPAWFQPAEATVTLALLEPYLDGTIEMGSFRLVNMFNMSPKAVEYGIILPLLAFVITAIYSAKRVHRDMVLAGIRPLVLSISRICIALTEAISGILFGGILGNVFDRWFSGGMVRDMLAYGNPPQR